MERARQVQDVEQNQGQGKWVVLSRVDQVELAFVPNVVPR